MFQNIGRKRRTLNLMIFINPHTINHREFPDLFDPVYNHFCAAGFQSNMVVCFKSHLHSFPFTASSFLSSLARQLGATT